MAKITVDDVLKVARLSRLKLTSEQVKKYQQELERILGYVEQLKAIKTDGVEPTAQITGLTNVMRPDELVDYHTTPEELLQNVPDKEDGYIKVKRVL